MPRPGGDNTKTNEHADGDGVLVCIRWLPWLRPGQGQYKHAESGADLDFGEGALPLLQRHLLDRDLLDDHEAPIPLPTVEVHNPVRTARAGGMQSTRKINKDKNVIGCQGGQEWTHPYAPRPTVLILE